MINTIEYYLEKHYTTVFSQEDDSFLAYIPALPGCVAIGNTLQEAGVLIEEAKKEWLETSFEKGEDDFELGLFAQDKANLHLNISNTLHVKLAQGAHQEGTNFNKYIASLLQYAIDVKGKAVLQ